MSTTTTTTKELVLITGANQGIGFEVSRALVLRGYHVLLGSRCANRGIAAAERLQQEGLSVEVVQLDVTDDNSIKRAVEHVQSTYGRLDVLINNAAIANDTRLEEPALESVRGAFMEQFNTNVFGAAAMTEAFTPLLGKSTLPRILFTSSGLASLTQRSDPSDRSYDSMVPIYRTSKAALNMLCLHYAAKYAKDGWKVNAVDPGHVATNLNRYKGPDPVQSGAIQLTNLVILGSEAPTGTFSRKEGIVPW